MEAAGIYWKVGCAYAMEHGPSLAIRAVTGRSEQESDNVQNPPPGSKLREMQGPRRACSSSCDDPAQGQRGNRTPPGSGDSVESQQKSRDTEGTRWERPQSLRKDLVLGQMEKQHQKVPLEVVSK